MRACVCVLLRLCMCSCLRASARARECVHALSFRPSPARRCLHPCCVCACDVCSCVVPWMCQYLSLYMHRYWHLHGAEHGTSCRLKFAKTAPRKRAPSWKDRKYQLWNRRRARNRPVRYDAKRSEHRVPELNRERKKGNTLNCHR